jgi:hypothetical protein
MKESYCMRIVEVDWPADDRREQERRLTQKKRLPIESAVLFRSIFL